MTVIWLDCSNHDRNRIAKPLPMPAIRADHCSAVIVKWSEGTWRDPFAVESLNAARAAGFPIIGVYHVVWPGQANQARFVHDSLARELPWLLSFPGRVVMADCEPFQEMPHAPSFAECVAFLNDCGPLFGLPVSARWAYMPWWVYGEQIRALQFPWIQSDYGTNPVGGAWALHPADTDPRYGKHAPTIPNGLQYGSQLSWDGLPMADGNAARFTDEAAFVRWVTGGDTDMGLTNADIPIIRQAVGLELNEPYPGLGADANIKRSLREWVRVNNYRINHDVMDAIASMRKAILDAGADDATKAQLDAAVGAIEQTVKAGDAALLAAIGGAPGASVAYTMTGKLEAVPPDATPPTT